MTLPTLIANGCDIECTLRDGALHGPWRRYYPDGQVLHETAYVEDDQPQRPLPEAMFARLPAAD